MNLNYLHLAHLRESGLLDETLEEHSFRSMDANEVTKQLGWKTGTLSGGYWILYPKGNGKYHDDFYRIRLDKPYIFKDMKEKQGAYSKKQREAKYLSPKGVKVRLYIPHPVWGVLSDVSVPLIFTEGEKKALKATQEGFLTIGLSGVYGWSRDKKMIEDFDQIKLEGRMVYIAFDSDKATNSNVQKAEEAFASALLSRGARVMVVNLPQDSGSVTKLDDFLVAKGQDALQELLENAKGFDKDRAIPSGNRSKKRKRRREEHEEEDGPSAAEIAEMICQDERLIYSAELFFAYRDGVYQVCHESIVRKKILKIIGTKTSFAYVCEILNFIKTVAFKDPSSLNNTSLLNIRNGLFDIDKHQLLDHSPEILSTIQLPVVYDLKAQCPKFIKTVYEIFDRDEERIEILQEFFGLCLTRETRYEKALICIGEGANGKSVLLGVLESLLGSENYTAIPLEKFNDTNYVANLFGKLANISVETSAKSEVYDSIFKSIVSGDSVQADLKFKNPFKFKPFCKLIFAMNNLPRVDDKTSAFFRRLIILRLNRQFSEAEQNKNLKYELIAELNGIFLWCLEGWRRLRKRGYFNISSQVQEEINEYRKDNNNVIIFVEDKCRFDAAESIDKGALYEIYSSYCKGNNYRPLSKKKFGMELKKQFKAVHDGRSGSDRYWEGINTDITK